MASTLHLFLFSIAVVFFSTSNGANYKPHAFHLPIRKDDVTLQYYTSFEVGPTQFIVDAVIDLGAPFLWFNCDDGYNSSSYNPVPCGSTKCKTAKGIGCLGCNGTPRPGCTNNTCSMYSYNPFDNSLRSGGLGKDNIYVYETDGTSVLLPMCLDFLLFVQIQAA